MNIERGDDGVESLYKAPELELIIIESRDIISTSNPTDVNQGEWDEQ